jgi:hypothetical protein
MAKAVAAMARDFAAQPDFNWKERDRTADGWRSYQVSIIDGTPYNRLLAVNGKPLSAAEEAEQMQKQKQEAEKRRAESPQARRDRIQKYQRDRTRDQNMFTQLTEAMNFSLIGTKRVRGFNVWVLKATPRPDYQPPNRDATVLKGMEGELWIDQKTYQWVHVRAVVIRPVSIEGFLAEVEPGTLFELQMMPVTSDIWELSHYAMKAHAKVLMLFNHNAQDDETHWDYEPVTSEAAPSIS